MKILIFGDTHLNQKFEPYLFDYISKLIKTADQVIINGDFWDAYLCSFDDFVNSKWKKLFPLLKNKNTIYLYGNHDSQKKCDHRVDLFSSQQSVIFEWKSKSGKRYIIRHGDTIAGDFDYKHPHLTKYFWWLYSLMFKLNKADNFIGKIYQHFDHKKCLGIFTSISEYAQKNIRDSEVLICGHSHIHKDDRGNHLVSIGPFWNKIARYLIIDGDKVELHEESYANLATNKK